MKVIRNNYNLKRIICDDCKSELEYDSNDVYVGNDRKYVKCPLCERRNYVDEVGRCEVNWWNSLNYYKPEYNEEHPFLNLGINWENYNKRR